MFARVRKIIDLSKSCLKMKKEGETLIAPKVYEDKSEKVEEISMKEKIAMIHILRS